MDCHHQILDVKPWSKLLLRERPLRVLLAADSPEDLDYPDPYVERVLLQLRETGLLDDDFAPTEEGEEVRDALSGLLDLEDGEGGDELSEMRSRAEGDVSVLERGRMLRQLSAMERDATGEEKRRIEEVRDLLD